MKRVSPARLVAVACLILTADALAQEQSTREIPAFRYGMRFGFNTASLRFSDGCHEAGEVFGVAFNENYSPNFFVGAQTEFGLSGRMSLGVGVQFVTKGWKSETTQTDLVTQVSVESKETIRMQYLQVPVLLNFHFSKARLSAGPYWAYALSGTEQSSVAGVEDFDLTFGSSQDDLYSQTDYGVGLEISYAISKRMNILAQFQQGIANQIPSDRADAAEARGSDNVARHRAFGLGFSILF
jgi:hypothetical protein